MDPRNYNAAKTFSAKTFDPKILLQEKPGRVDPWARAEAWRYTGPFTRWNRFKGTFPGLGTAIVAFAGYCAYEHFFLKDEHHGNGHHGEGHH
ncbi:NADH-ubiquinone oxidoreductase B12 subunit family-domain-containing protein [Pyronema omphalodes]|nr:NADH-ubiquinone oxidoreductase B12 subunit family-domain-containing protein [Pyronema omphalodes]